MLLSCLAISRGNNEVVHDNLLWPLGWILIVVLWLPIIWTLQNISHRSEIRESIIP